VRAGFKSHKDDRFSACVNEVPGSVIHGDMDMAKARGNAYSGFTEYGHDPEVLRAVLNEDTTRG
jgi:hypothetical protein